MKDQSPIAPLAPLPRKNRIREFWLLFGQNRLASVGLVIFILFFLMALVGLFLTSGPNPVFDPAMVRLEEKLRAPLSLPHPNLLETGPRSGIYLLGTDNLGRDVLARMLQGAWVSLTVGFVAVGISLIVGIFLGGLAGFYGQTRLGLDHLGIVVFFLLSLIGFVSNAGGMATVALGVGVGIIALSVSLRGRGRGAKHRSWVRVYLSPAFSVDTLIMRLVDIMLCFPSFFLILTVVALLPASLYNIMVVIGLTSWMGATRFVRAEFLSLREQDFVTAARALGVRNLRIIFRHMMPNAIGPVLVSATIGIASAILTEAGLSFLGFGVPPPHATWGNILSDGKDYIFDAPWLTFSPGIAILIVVLSFNLFGEGLRDALNPRLRERL